LSQGEDLELVEPVETVIPGPRWVDCGKSSSVQQTIDSTPTH